MSTHTKHTQGLAKVAMNGESVWLDNTNTLCNLATHLPEYKANATLIAEAFNVTNECGLTPKQLLEQRNELLEAIKYYMDGSDHFFECIDFGKSFLDAKAITFMNEHGIKFKEAINKATNK